MTTFQQQEYTLLRDTPLAVSDVKSNKGTISLWYKIRPGSYTKHDQNFITILNNEVAVSYGTQNQPYNSPVGPSGSAAVFDPGVSSVDPSGLSNDATVYNGGIIDGPDTIPITFVGSANQTIQDVIDTFNAALTGVATVSLSPWGWLTLLSATRSFDLNDTNTYVYFNDTGSPGTGLIQNLTNFQGSIDIGTNIIGFSVAGVSVYYDNDNDNYIPSMFSQVFSIDSGSAPENDSMQIQSLTTIDPTSTEYNNIIFTWDLSLDEYHCYLNGVDTTDPDSTGPGDPDSTSRFIEWSTGTTTYPNKIGSYTIGNGVEGCLAEIYINTQEYIADPVPLFYNAGAIVDLGTDGSTPTGTAPTFYMKLIPATPGLNSSGRGDFVPQYDGSTSSITECP